MTRSSHDWHQLGRQLQEQGQLPEAERAYHQALRLDPGRLRSLNNLAVLCMGRERYAEAEALLDQALNMAAERWADPLTTHRPELAQEWALLLNSRCQLALHHDQFQEARLWARVLLKLQPDAPGLANLGVTLSWLNQPAAARRSQWLGLGGDREPIWPQEPLGPPLALWTAPGSAFEAARLHQQLCNLATGFLDRDPLARDGWQLLLARLATEPAAWLAVPQPWQGLWSGEPLQQLVVWDEQGYGDALQCLRWLPAACERVDQLIVLLRPELLELVRQRLALPAHCNLQTLDPARDRPWDRGMIHCPLMALPAALLPPGARIALEATPVLQRWAQPTPDQRRFGLVWAAGQKDNPEARRSARLRSMPAELLLAHAQTWEADLLALQLGPELEQARPWIEAGLLDTLEPGGCWLQSAQLVERLDVVITVDTAMAHLAGSLGVPCVLLLNQVCDWRWFAGDIPVPWYSSVRILRAPALNAWEPLLQQVPGVIDAMLVS